MTPETLRKERARLEAKRIAACMSAKPMLQAFDKPYVIEKLKSHTTIPPRALSPRERLMALEDEELRLESTQV